MSTSTHRVSQALFGDEPRLAERLRDAAAARGLAIRVGIAASRIGALAAARLGSGATVVEPGGDAAALAAAPLSLLVLSEDLATRLARWGLRTLGELAALPTAGLFERAGAEGVQAQRLARGEDPRPLASWRPAPAFEESVECEWGLETLEPVVERLGEMAARVCACLGARGLAADGFEWVCRLAAGHAHEGALTPAVPLTEATAVTGLLRLALEARPPRGIVLGLTLRARPVRMAPAQESLTDPSRPSPRFLAATMNRLVALVGSDRIGAPALLDSHRPDAVGLGPYAPSPSPLRGEGGVRGGGGEGRRQSRPRPAPPPPPGSGRGHPRLRPPGRHALEPSRRAYRGRRGTVAVVGRMVDHASVAAGRVGRGAGRRHALPPGPRRLRLASRRHLRLMVASPARPAVTVLVTDMDNTLFDWLGMWQAAFGAMLERLVADSGVPRETLEEEFFALHQRHGTTEYAFAIQELPSLRARHPPEELPTRYAAAIEAYRTMRRRTLALYPGVLDTLRAVRAAGALVVAYTESRAYYADYRVRTLGLDGALDYLYSLPDHALPEGMTPSQIRRYPPEHYRLRSTEHRHTREGAWKPDASVLLEILRDVGAEPGRAVYVGDSLVKDVAMAQAASVVDVFARYGDVRSRPGYALLRRVTHWSPAMMARSEALREADVRPTHVLVDGFAELLALVDFHRFTV